MKPMSKSHILLSSAILIAWQLRAGVAQYRSAPGRLSLPYVSRCCGLEVDSDYKAFMKCVNDSATANNEAVSAEIKTKAKLNRSTKGPENKKIRFGLLTFATEDIFDYASYGFAVNEAFAEHHGYKLKLLHNTLPHYDQHDSRWNKVIVLIDALNSDWAEGLDYVMWLDADLVFLDMYMDLEALVSQYSHAHFIASSEFIGGSTMINSGACIVKNSEWGRDFLSRWWTFSNRSYYSDQEQFDMMVHSYGQEYIDSNVVILPPNIINSDPPAMEKQRPSDQVLHLMGEHSHLRIKTFKTGFQEICRHLSDNTESVISQLGMTQPNILKWTLELYSAEMKLLMARYEAKMNDGLNTYSESRKLSNSVHHYCHGLKVLRAPDKMEESDDLRRRTFYVLTTNLHNRRRLNMEHALQHGYGLLEWPEHVKTVAEAGGHLTKIGSPKDRMLASQQVLLLLQEVSDNVTPMQRNAVDSIIAHTQNELSMALLDMQDVDGALKYQKMSLKRMRSVAQSSGLHHIIRPLETVANTLSILNRHDEAFQHFEETLGIIRKLYQTEDVPLARVLVNYGLSCYFGAMKTPNAVEKRDLVQSSYEKLTEGVQILKRLGVPTSDESHSRGVEYIAKALQQGARPKGSSGNRVKEGTSGKKTSTTNKNVYQKTDRSKRMIDREL